VAKACAKAEKEGFDGVFVDCFGDPGVRAARELVRIPVFGGFEPSVLMAMGLADRFAIITVVPGVAPMVRSNVARAGIESRVSGISCVDIPVMALKDKDALLKALRDKAVAACRDNGAEAVVLGCTAMIGVAERLEGILKESGMPVPVIEPAQAALSLLETFARMRLSHSLRTYPRPAWLKEAIL
jgi:allantoin racemase